MGVGCTQQHLGLLAAHWHTRSFPSRFCPMLSALLLIVARIAAGEQSMLATRFTQLVGGAVPIQQAGMGAGSPPALAAAVSTAGALGMVGAVRPGFGSVASLAPL